MSLSNYPAGVSDAHPYFNPPDPVACRECGEDTWPGEDCENCGHYTLTAQEAAEDAAIDRAEDMADHPYDYEWEDY